MLGFCFMHSSPRDGAAHRMSGREPGCRRCQAGTTSHLDTHGEDRTHETLPGVWKHREAFAVPHKPCDWLHQAAQWLCHPAPRKPSVRVVPLHVQADAEQWAVCAESAHGVPPAPDGGVRGFVISEGQAEPDVHAGQPLERLAQRLQQEHAGQSASSQRHSKCRVFGGDPVRAVDRAI